jgi:hypothetical protein
MSPTKLFPYFCQKTMLARSFVRSVATEAAAAAAPVAPIKPRFKKVAGMYFSC